MNFLRGLDRPGKALLALLLVTLGMKSFSQNLTISSVSLRGEDVVIKYDLIDDNLDHKYTLSIYSSLDNYVQPLKELEGDIGIDQAVGGNKEVVWHAKKELGDDFNGAVALEIKGKLYVPFVTLNNFGEISHMKRDRPYNMTWAAGRGSNVLTIDLLNKKDEVVHTYTNIANVGEYQLEIPKDIKPGKDYRFRITDQRNKEDVVFTPSFVIKRKVPLMAKVGLLGLAGSGLFVVSSASGEAGAAQADLLPDPILPSTSN